MNKTASTAAAPSLWNKLPSATRDVLSPKRRHFYLELLMIWFLFYYFETGDHCQIVSVTFWQILRDEYLLGLMSKTKNCMIFETSSPSNFATITLIYRDSGSHTNNIFRHVEQALHGYYRTHLPALQRTLPVPAFLEVLDLPVKRDSFSSGPVKRRTSHVTNSN